MLPDTPPKLVHYCILKNKLYPILLGIGLLFVAPLVSKTLGALGQCVSTPPCVPGNPSDAASQGLQSGIRTVTIGSQSLTNPFVPNTGYIDRFCRDSITLFRGTTNRIVITNGPNVNESVRVWIDLNGDGQLDPLSELVFSSNSARTHTGTFVIPVTAPSGQLLRMRIASDRPANAANIAPCFRPQIGQVLDLSIKTRDNNRPPVAAFDVVGDTISCGSAVAFRDLTNNAPTTWEWDFGDGTTSTESNPLHAFDSARAYTIRLIVSNAFGRDTLIRPNYILVRNRFARPAQCEPVTNEPCCGYTIRNLRIGTQLSAVGIPEVEGYQDLSCRVQGTFLTGVSYRLSFVSSANQPQDTKVWLDKNNNGNFEEPGELIGSVLNAANPNFVLSFPSLPDSLLGVPLRLRVGSDFAGSSFGPCFGMTHGKYQDYTVFINPNNQRPDAQFILQSSNGCNGTYQFAFSGSVGGSRYDWEMGDGTVYSGNQTTVSHTYRSMGTYSVRLIVTNAVGSDTAEVTDAASFIGNIGAPPCQPFFGGYCCNDGLTALNMGSFSINRANPLPNFTDNSCAIVISLRKQQSLPVTINCGRSNRISVFMDYNKDGAFSDFERIFLSTTAALSHSFSFRLPDSLTLNRPFKMRIISANVLNNLSACANSLISGSAEDMTIIPADPLGVPVARFSISNARDNCYRRIQFVDQTRFRPSQWLWKFMRVDGTLLGQSNLSMPSFVFPQAGTYRVRLIVSNSLGLDSVEQSNLTISDGNGLLAPLCRPVIITYSSSYTWSSLIINNQPAISNPAMTSFYTDLGCSNVYTINRGQNFPITMNVPVPFIAATVFVDWNGDGIFQTDERTILSSNGVAMVGNIIAPMNGSANRIRMRFLLDQNFSNTGCETQQTGQVVDVGLQLSQPTSPPNAVFSLDNLNLCTGEVRFNNQTTGAVADTRWEFGDGRTSTDFTPTHQYANSGTYTVRLIASNVRGADTATRTVRYNRIALPANTCIPSPSVPSPFSAAGITRVRFGTIDRISEVANVEGSYQDRACQDTTWLVAGQTYTLRVEMGAALQETVKAWLDFNADGILSDDETVLNTTGFLEATSTFPISVNSSTSGFVRLRITDDLGRVTFASSCDGGRSGQTEDYAVRIFNPLSTSDRTAMTALWKLYPTVVNDQINLEGLVRAGSDPVIYTLRDIKGRTLDIQHLRLLPEQTSTQLAVPQLATGMYVVQIQSGSQVKAWRVLKN